MPTPRGYERCVVVPFSKPITPKEKCERLIKDCGRLEEKLNVNKIKRSTYICSKHFMGEKGPILDHPDPMNRYVPYFVYKHQSYKNV